jgi:hypothetical protein
MATTAPLGGARSGEKPDDDDDNDDDDEMEGEDGEEPPESASRPALAPKPNRDGSSRVESMTKRGSYGVAAASCECGEKEGTKRRRKRRRRGEQAKGEKLRGSCEKVPAAATAAATAERGAAEAEGFIVVDSP